MLEETTIHQIRSTISKLEQEGTKVTIIEIARRLGMSKQRVHFVLSKHEELDSLPPQNAERVSHELLRD